MKRLLGSAAVAALGGAVLLAPPALADATLATSTQVVNFSLADSYCPQHGLYGIAHVTVDGTAGMTADQNFIWTTQKAATSIHSVPAEGAVANVTILYHCNVQVLWWLEPGNARKVIATVWVNGSGEQTDYTISPDQPNPRPTSPTQPATGPIPPAQPSQSVQPAPAPRQPVQPAPAPTEPAQPASTPPQPAPAPTQQAKPAPAPTQPAEPAPAPSQQAKPAPARTQPAEPAPAPTQPARPAPSPTLTAPEPSQPAQPAPSPTLTDPEPTQPALGPTQPAADPTH